MLELVEGRDYLTYRKAENKIPNMIAKTLIDQCSAFLKTLNKQYQNAAIHRNHSRAAANMTRPTITV